MTIYTVIATEFHDEGETLVELFAHEEDAIARMRELYEQACADPEITEQCWSDGEDGCLPCCSWFDFHASYNSTCVWVDTRELQ